MLGRMDGGMRIELHALARHGDDDADASSEQRDDDGRHQDGEHRRAKG